MQAVIRDGMRGLGVFISDIRKCKSKEEEVKRINKELSNIRCKFQGDKILDGSQKKKYVSKLLFIFLLGHDIDFGHMEAINLLSSNKYSEKRIGYLFISVLVNTNSDLLIQLIIQNIKNELASGNVIQVNLALQCIANIGNKEMAEAFGRDILKVLVSCDTLDFVKQSAALCLLRLFHTSQEIIPGGEWTSQIVDLLNNKHLGVVTAAVSLIDALVKRNPDEYKDCISLAVSRLCRIVPQNFIDLWDYSYYFVPAPWLSVKLLRLLQNYAPIVDPIVGGTLNECLEKILIKAHEQPKSKKIQHSNAKNAVLFEAIRLIVHNDNEPNLLVGACNQLGQFLSNRETNLRYLALESMCLLVKSEFCHEAVKEHQKAVIVSMKMETDISVRQQAIDLLYAMCDYSNAEEIVQEMLNYLDTADYSLREEMVLKVAILAEKYATDYTWYVDVILGLIHVAGDYVSEEIWYRLIQIVINRDDVQGYAAKTVFEALKAPACHEKMVKVGGYILGEFGNLIAGDKSSAPTVQFHLLHSKYHLCSPMTKALLLSTYMKFVNLFPELKPVIQEVFRQHCNICSADAELQQRASEYLQLSIIASTNVLATVLEGMPAFPERESSTLALKKKKPGNEISLALAHNIRTDHAPNHNSNSLQAVTRNGATDVLGLSTPSPPSNTATVLLDFLGDDYIGGSSMNSITSTITQQDTYDPNKFVCTNNGVLFENDLIKIGVTCEFRKNLGRLNLFYGNKMSLPLQGFTVLLISPNDWVSKLRLQIQPVEPVLYARVQIQQIVNVECIEDYADAPCMNVSFIYNDVPQNLTLKLPIFINKFFEPVEMNSKSFFERWKNLGGSSQKNQFIFCATQDMDLLATRTKLIGFGMQLLEGIDPNPDNFVCAGIIHTRTQLIGCLLRLEPNKQNQMYRLTVKSRKESVSQEICELLHDHF